MIKITVIIAGWRPDGVKQAINDLDKQTFKDFDVILVNDGNPDLRSVALDLTRGRENYHFVDNYTRCHYYGAISRNMAAMMAFMYQRESKRDMDNEYIVFHDDDVLFTHNLLEEMKNSHERNPKSVLIIPGITEIRGKINTNYRHKRATIIAPQNIDLNGLAFQREVFIKNGCLDANPRYKISYDYELIKKIYEQYGDEHVEFTKNDSRLIFYHKRR
jgi:GT2 family glycosyltransferase